MRNFDKALKSLKIMRRFYERLEWSEDVEAVDEVAVRVLKEGAY